VSWAPVLAFAAGVCGVLGAWDGLAALDGRAPLRALERWLAPLRAGREPTRAERRRLALVGAGTLAASGWLLAGPVLATLLGTLGPAAAKVAVATRARRRRNELAAGAAAVARALADAIAAGHSVRGAIQAAAGPNPSASSLRDNPLGLGGAVGEELARAARALELGEPTDAVLDELRRRAGDPGWDTLTAAILLQAEAGGDLAGLLRGLAARADQQRRDAADARSATAQARFTAWLVAALPIAAAILAELASPGFLAGLLAEPLTAVLAGLSLALQLLAIAAIRGIAGASGSVPR
jgi:tight adherence protein B